MIRLPERLTDESTTLSTLRVSPITDPRWSAAEHSAADGLPLPEVFFQHACHLLHNAEVSDRRRRGALESLAARGFPLAGLSRLPLGLFLDAQALKETLLASGFTMAALNTARVLADRRLAGRLVSPIRDLDGTIVSFWARHPADTSPLYLYLNRHWRAHVPAIGLETALAVGGEEDLLLVEDPLESLLLHAHGLMNTAAWGASWRELGAKRWQALFELGIRRITLLVDALDFDPGVLAAIRHAARVGRIEQVYLIGARRVRAWLTGDRSGLVADPRLLWNRLCHERIPAARYRLRSIRLPVFEANLTPPQAPTHRPAPLPTPLPAAAPPRILVSSRTDRCTLHRCGETDCFCFD